MFLNLHDLLTLKIVNCPEAFKKFICDNFQFQIYENSGQKGPSLEFVDKLPVQKPVYCLTADTGYYADNFFIIDYNNNKLVVPFDLDICNWCLKCEKDFDPLRLYNLIDALVFQFTLFECNCAFVHASSCVVKGKGVAISGWKKTGKTAIVLKYLFQGAQFISDDHCIVSKQGEMFSYLRPTYIPYAALDDFPQLKRKIPFRLQAKIPIKKIWDQAYRCMPRGKTVATKMSDVFNNLAQLHSNIPINFKTLFPNSLTATKFDLQLFFYIKKWNGEDIYCQKVDKRVLSGRLAHSSRYEYRSFFDYYQIYRTAFPDRDNVMFREYESRIANISYEALKKADCYDVHIPADGNIIEVADYLYEKFL